MSSLGPSSGQGFSSPYSSKQSGQTSGKSVENTAINPDEQSGSESSALPNGSQSQASISQSSVPVDALFRNDLSMNSAQVARLLKNLLQLPNEILELLSLFSQLEPSNADEILQKLSQGQVNVSLDELQSFLLERLDNSQSKLMKLIQNNGGESGSSLSKLLRLREELAEQAEKSTVDAVKTLITLYLPNLPLRDLQEFRLRFLTPNLPVEKQVEGGKKEDEAGDYQLSGDAEQGGGKDDDARWLITIRTYTWGEFRIVLVINADRGKAQTLIAQIGHGEEARSILPEIKSGLTLAMKNDKLPEPILTFVAKSHAKSGSNTQVSRSKKTPQTFEEGLQTGQAAHVQAVNAPASVPAIGIHWAYRIIRLILDLDNKALSDSQKV
jgi:hypothetical protein